jgi:hypothetical protein
MQIIKKAQIKTKISFILTYHHIYLRDVTYTFNCDKRGDIDTKLTDETQMAMYNFLKDHEDYCTGGPEGFMHSYPEPGEFVCDCGKTNVTYMSMHLLCPHCGNVYDGDGKFLKQMDVLIKDK